MNTEGIIESKKNISELLFFAILPNGKKIPVESICEHYNLYPEQTFLRTFDDRLVLVIEAVMPKGYYWNGNWSHLSGTIPIPGETYWKQAFYFSSGQSSGMRNTWLPFNGIVMKPRRRTNLNKNLKHITVGWFEKEHFVGSGIPGLNMTCKKTDILNKLSEEAKKELDLYNTFYLKEGQKFPDYTKNNNYHAYYRFDSRFGPVSYLLASYKLGGSEFGELEENNNDDAPAINMNNMIRRIINRQKRDKEKIKTHFPILTTLKLQLEYRNPLPPSPVKQCYILAQKSLPKSKVNVVNDYIERNEALTIHNAFRNTGIVIKPLSKVAAFYSHLGYSIPLYNYYRMFNIFVDCLFKQYIAGLLTKEQVQENVNKSMKEIAEIFFDIKLDFYPNNNKITFIVENADSSMNFYGGRKTRRKMNKKHKTMKKHR